MIGNLFQPNSNSILPNFSISMHRFLPEFYMDNEEQRTLFLICFSCFPLYFTVQRKRESRSVIKWIRTFYGKEHRHGGCTVRYYT